MATQLFTLRKRIMTVNSFIQKIRYGSNFNKPLYMLKLAGNVLRSKYLGQTPLRGVDFAVNYSCNLECKHCFNDTLLKGEKKMELNDYARVIKESIKLGAISFAFQGGEILLLKGFEDILRLVDSKKYSLSITTNGLLLSKDMVKKLKYVGVNTVTISLDSGLAEEHDRFRGKNGSFACATQGIDRLLKNGIKVVINSTITPDFLRSEGFHKLLEFSKSKKLLINTIFAAPSGRWSNNDKIILKEEDIKLYDRIVGNNPYVVRDLDSGYSKRGCQGGTESIYITPYGDVLPCPYIHIRAGNIFNESLKTIRDRAMSYFSYQVKCMIAENSSFIDQYIKLTKTENLPLSEKYLTRITAWNN